MVAASWSCIRTGFPFLPRHSDFRVRYPFGPAVLPDLFYPRQRRWRPLPDRVRGRVGLRFPRSRCKHAGVPRCDPFEGGAGYLSISPDGTRVYLPVLLPRTCQVRLLAFDIARGSIAGVLGLPMETPGVSAASILALSPEGARAYVQSVGPSNLLVINTVSNRIAASLLLLVGRFVLSSDSRRAHAAGPDSLLRHRYGVERGRDCTPALGWGHGAG